MNFQVNKKYIQSPQSFELCLVGHGPGIPSDNLILSMGYLKEIIFKKPLDLGV